MHIITLINLRLSFSDLIIMCPMFNPIVYGSSLALNTAHTAASTFDWPFIVYLHVYFCLVELVKGKSHILWPWFVWIQSNGHLLAYIPLKMIFGMDDVRSSRHVLLLVFTKASLDIYIPTKHRHISLLYAASGSSIFLSGLKLTRYPGATPPLSPLSTYFNHSPPLHQPRTNLYRYTLKKSTGFAQIAAKHLTGVYCLFKW